MAQKILIIEDEPAVQTALKNKLSRNGFAVITAANGQTGLTKVAQHSPDLILLDIIMPVMDGITFLTKLRSLPLGRTIPVIVLTNLSDTQKFQAGIDLNVSGYLIKSDWKLDDLVIKIEKVFAAKK
ncbi:MAG: response regulator [Candidatus Shapirobacteria bacterium]|jgi:two-component system response regulator MprA